MRGGRVDSPLNPRCEQFVDKSYGGRRSFSPVAIMLIVSATGIHLSRLTYKQFFNVQAYEEL